MRLFPTGLADEVVLNIPRRWQTSALNASSLGNAAPRLEAMQADGRVSIHWLDEDLGPISKLVPLCRTNFKPTNAQARSPVPHLSQTDQCRNSRPRAALSSNRLMSKPVPPCRTKFKRTNVETRGLRRLPSWRTKFKRTNAETRAFVPH